MVPSWVPIIIWPVILGYPKRDHNFDNQPYSEDRPGHATSELAAICMAMSAVNSLKMALLATKSVSLFTCQLAGLESNTTWVVLTIMVFWWSL